jgi:proline iminopeptidase
MQAKRLALVCLSAAAICWLTCSPPDVRLGMGDGAGVKLSYRIVGKGRPLVVIHDGPGYEKSIMYKGFDALSSDMKVIYYDQRGCGKSEPLAPTSALRVEDNVHDLENLRQFLHLRRMSLAAHGWGAVIALEYARAYPRQVDAIILIAPVSPFVPDPELRAVIDNLPQASRMRIVTALGNPGLSTLERREIVMRETLPGLFYKAASAEDAGLESIKLAPDVSLRLGDELKTLDLFSVLGEITQPTLIIAGRHDISIPMREQIAYADGIRQAGAVVFNESGHFPFLEERAFFLNLVRKFLERKSVPTLAGAAALRAN